jgi:phosphatidylserine/phosphatidylglycerophosphate/cardiolipin synthase-like enzyme
VSHRVVIVLLVLVAVAPFPATAAATVGDSNDARFVGAFPDPATPDDVGEFVTVRAPAGTPLTLADGESRVSVVAPGGTVAVATDPDAAANFTPHPVLAPGLELANGGESLTLSVDGRVVDRLSYDRSREGELLERRDGAWTWWPRTLPRRPVTTHGPSNATLFVLPDASAVPTETLRRAEDRLLLAGYVVSSPRVADELVAARENGVRVSVLVDDAPVGGFPRPSARVLDRLVAAGVTVRVVGDPHAFHHAKYAVVDDTALVTTENWKPAGTGGRKSRGWGVVVESRGVATDLAATYEDDATLPATQSWKRFRTGRTFVAADVADASYPARVAPETVHVDRLSVIRAPDNAESAVVAHLGAADARIDVIQPTVEPDGPFVVAVKQAAKRGVRVRILLGSAWYVADENRAFAARLNRWAERIDAPLTVRVARPSGRFGAVHAKGVVADDTVVVGSMNWNRHSARENREVAVAITDPAAARYYRDAFVADWRAADAGADTGGTVTPDRRTSLTLVFGALCSLVVAAVVLKKTVRFE